MPPHLPINLTPCWMARGNHNETPMTYHKPQQYWYPQLPCPQTPLVPLCIPNPLLPCPPQQQTLWNFLSSKIPTPALSPSTASQASNNTTQQLDTFLTRNSQPVTLLTTPVSPINPLTLTTTTSTVSPNTMPPQQLTLHTAGHNDPWGDIWTTKQPMSCFQIVSRIQVHSICSILI